MRKMNLPKCDERIEKMCMRKMSLPRCDERKIRKKSYIIGLDLNGMFPCEVFSR